MLTVDRSGKASLVTLNGEPVKGSKLNGTDQATVSFAINQITNLENAAAKAELLDADQAKKYRQEAESYRKVVTDIMPAFKDLGKKGGNTFDSIDLATVSMALKSKNQAALDSAERRYPGIVAEAKKKANSNSGGITEGW